MQEELEASASLKPDLIAYWFLRYNFLLSVEVRRLILAYSLVIQTALYLLSGQW